VSRSIDDACDGRIEYVVRRVVHVIDCCVELMGEVQHDHARHTYLSVVPVKRIECCFLQSYGVELSTSETCTSRRSCCCPVEDDMVASPSAVYANAEGGDDGISRRGISASAHSPLMRIDAAVSGPPSLHNVSSRTQHTFVLKVASQTGLPRCFET
jgi:hypothetical protein